MRDINGILDSSEFLDQFVHRFPSGNGMLLGRQGVHKPKGVWLLYIESFAREARERKARYFIKRRKECKRFFPLTLFT